MGRLKNRLEFLPNFKPKSVMAIFTELRIPRISYANPCCTFVISCDDGYLPHAGTMLHSFAKAANGEFVYEVILLDGGLSDVSFETLSKLTQVNPKVKLRRLKMQGAFQPGTWDTAYPEGAYYRLAIPELLADFEKVVYLDVDLVVLKDPAILFHFNLENKPMAAALNGSAYEVLTGEKSYGKFNVNSYDYYTKVLELSEAETYLSFNSGVMVLDLSLIRKRNDLEKIKMDLGKNFTYADQDYLNRLYKGDLHEILDFEWNATNNTLDERNIRDYNLYKKLLRAQNNPSIVHFTDKPWRAASWRWEAFNARYYWRFLKATPWFNAMRKKFKKDRKSSGALSPIQVSIKKAVKKLPFMKWLVKTIRGLN